jgi:sulfate transport system substrate-binding protein
VDFLYTPAAQKIFVDKGYRPVVKDTPGADKFRPRRPSFDITKFGGWDKVNTDFFDPEKGIVAKIFQDQGKSTESG